MSLQIWLPLDGDLHNQGVSGLTFIPGSGSSEYIDISESPGKTGLQCYEGFSNTASTNGQNAIRSVQTINLGITNKVSMFCWCNIDSSTTNGIVSCVRYKSPAYSGISLNAYEDKIGMSYGYGTDYTTVSVSANVGLGVWQHIGFVYNGSTVDFYLNGLKVGTKTLTTYPNLVEDKIFIGAWGFSSGDYSVSNIYTKYRLDGRINDVRVYDHALSPKEVEEISKGLIGHYKLDKIETLNYVQSPYDRAEAVASVSTDNTFTNIVLNSYINTLPGSKVYTYSVYIYNTSDADIVASLRLYNGSTALGTEWKYGNRISPNTEGLSVVTLDGTSLSDVNTARCRLVYYVPGTTTQKKRSDMTSGFSYQYVKLEQSPVYTYWTPGEQTPNPTIYDCSGFSHNGTATQSLPIIKGSPRYDAALKFDGTSYVSCVSPCTEARTVSFWVNFDSVPSGVTSIFMDYKSKIGFGIGSSQNFICSTRGISSKMFSKPELSANTWYHFVIVAPNGADDTARQLYMNGIEQTSVSSSSYWTYNINELQIGKRSSSSDGFVGKISDVRVYATALTAAAIKELYNTSMTVDASGNVYARELVQL